MAPPTSQPSTPDRWTPATDNHALVTAIMETTIGGMPLQTLALARGPVLRGYQSNVVLALLKSIPRCPAATFTVMFPRQAGKNEVSSVLVACLLRTHAEAGGSIIVCAPTLTPQATISQERTLRAITATDRVFGHEVRAVVEGNHISVGRATATFLSASPAAHVAGHTASIALIADEAQDIDSDWFDRQFRPMAASTAAPTVMFGTPWDGETLLERAAAANRKADARRTGQPGTNFIARHYQVSWREVADWLPVYGDYVLSELARLGAGHPLFRTQYDLMPVAGGGRLFSPAQLTAIDGGHPRLHLPCVGERYVAGLDFGGEGAGADATVLTIARVIDGRCEVVEHVSWVSKPFETVVKELCLIFGRWRPARVSADATGMGGPLCARLAPVLDNALDAFTFSGPSKSELGYTMLAAAGTGGLALYADDGSNESRACRAELRACRSTNPAGGLLRWAAPSGGHDDYVASLALCVRAAANVPPVRVARGRA